MMNLTPNTLLSFLKNNNYSPADIEQESQQPYTVLKIEKKEFPLFLRIYEQGFLQLIVFIPSHMESNPLMAPTQQSLEAEAADQQSDRKRVLGDMARLLHLFNKELDVPGFGMDESKGVVFFRVMIPIQEEGKIKKFDSKMLLAFMRTAEYVCKMFSQSIEAVSTGQMTLDEIITKAKEMDKK